MQPKLHHVSRTVAWKQMNTFFFIDFCNSLEVRNLKQGNGKGKAKIITSIEYNKCDIDCDFRSMQPKSILYAHPHQSNNQTIKHSNTTKLLKELNMMKNESRIAAKTIIIVAFQVM